MRIAITDACIFIDIYDLQLTSKFFLLELDMHTSYDVFNELYDEHQELLRAYQVGGKLTIHSLKEADRHEMRAAGYPAALSDNDKTVLHLAAKLDAFVLSSDKAVRQQAKKRKIDYHGMLWIFDRLVETGQITTAEASEKLQLLIKRNVVYRGNNELVTEMNKRLKAWGS